jgi:15-cis-phytoene synthase
MSAWTCGVSSGRRKSKTMVGIGHPATKRGQSIDGSFATARDHAICRQIHRRYGPTYYLASRRFPQDIRRRTHALYAFVRVPDEWVDNPGRMSVEARLERLRHWRGQLLCGIEGIIPEHPAMRAFCDTIQECGIAVGEPLAFLEAMDQDLSVSRYETYQELRDYMRGSAVAVGRMMCAVLEAQQTESVERGASALAEAMQLTNFLRDVGEDASRGRIYLPAEDLASFEVRESEILDGKMSPRFVNLMRFQIARARALYAEADRAIPLLPDHSRNAVRLSRVLYSRILDKIEYQNFNVFTDRTSTSKLEKLWIASQLILGRQGR